MAKGDWNAGCGSFDGVVTSICDNSSRVRFFNPVVVSLSDDVVSLAACRPKAARQTNTRAAALKQILGTVTEKIQGTDRSAYWEKPIGEIKGHGRC
jgi:hypothetical protein